MLISQFFEYLYILGGRQFIEYAPVYAFCWETGNYIFISDGHNVSLCVYLFCNVNDAEKILSLSYDDALKEYFLVIARKQIRGDVVIPFLVCGKITKRGKNLAIDKWTSLGAKKMLYYKTKTKKFFIYSLVKEDE